MCGLKRKMKLNFGSFQSAKCIYEHLSHVNVCHCSSEMIGRLVKNSWIPWSLCPLGRTCSNHVRNIKIFWAAMLLTMLPKIEDWNWFTTTMSFESYKTFVCFWWKSLFFCPNSFRWFNFWVFLNFWTCDSTLRIFQITALQCLKNSCMAVFFNIVKTFTDENRRMSFLSHQKKFVVCILKQRVYMYFESLSRNLWAFEKYYCWTLYSRLKFIFLLKLMPKSYRIGFFHSIIYSISGVFSLNFLLNFQDFWLNKVRSLFWGYGVTLHQPALLRFISFYVHSI